MPFRSRPEALHQRERQLVTDRRELSEQLRQVDAELARVRSALDDPDHQPALEGLAVASPCSARWDDMEGDDRVRHCRQCDKKVYNLESLTRREARELFAAQREPCVRLRRRRDGTVVSSDCPEGARLRRRRQVAGVALMAGVGAGVSAAYATTVTMGALPSHSRFLHAGPPTEPARYPLSTVELERLQQTFGPDVETVTGAVAPPPEPVHLPEASAASAMRYHLVLDRATVDALLRQAGRGGKTSALVEERPGGKVVRFMNVAPGSKLHELGLRSGDRLVSLNGYRVASPEQSLAAYESLRGASEAGGPTVPGHAVLEIERDGKPVFLTYALE